MKTSTVVSLSLVMICSICFLGFASSAEEPAALPDASHSVIVFENVESSVVTFDEEKNRAEACSVSASAVCLYQLGSVAGQEVCFSFACQTDICCVGLCPESGGDGPSRQEDSPMQA
jgi:hypothetical protein